MVLPLHQYFHMVLFIQNLNLTFESVDEILCWDLQLSPETGDKRGQGKLPVLIQIPLEIDGFVFTACTIPFSDVIEPLI